MSGKERLELRYSIHVAVREAIDRWNAIKQVLHMGHKIDLAAEITEAVMDAKQPNENSQ